MQNKKFNPEEPAHEVICLGGVGENGKNMTALNTATIS